MNWVSNGLGSMQPLPRFTAACSLCGGHQQTLAQLPVRALADVYRRRFGVDVAQYFVGCTSLELLCCGQCGLAGFQPAIAGDGSFYEQLGAWFESHEHGAPSLDRKPDHQVALRHVRPGDHVLEVGGAAVGFSRYLPASTRYVGLELNPAYVTLARAQGTDMRAETIEAHSKTHSARYDVVCHFQVIEHVPTPRPFLEACFECLKPGGRLVIGCPNNESFLAVEPDNVLNMPPHHVFWFSRKPLEWIAQHWQAAILEVREERLEPQYREAFARQIWLSVLGPVWHSPQRFTLGGCRFRVANLIARSLARLTAPLFARLAPAISGHTMTIVYEKPLEAGKP